MEQKTKLQIVDALSGSQIGAIVAYALGVEIDGPRFTSKATITSDGFVQAGFVGSDGRAHHGAFVGSYDELKQQLRSVNDYLERRLDLEHGAQSELFNAVAFDWIATDYRS